MLMKHQYGHSHGGSNAFRLFGIWKFLNRRKIGECKSFEYLQYVASECNVYSSRLDKRGYGIILVEAGFDDVFKIIH